MRMMLSSSRAFLATQLFRELTFIQRIEGRKQVILVPEPSIGSFLLLQAAKEKVSLLTIEMRLFSPPKLREHEQEVLHFFGFREFSIEEESFGFGESIWYFFSPCAHFWSDLLSEKEIGKQIAHVEKKEVKNTVQKALESFYHDSNSLLADAAPLGRRSALRLDESSFQFQAMYPIPSHLMCEDPYQDLLYGNHFSPVDEEVTLLRRVQSDLICLVGTREKPFEIPSDSSLLLVEATTIRSELQAIREKIAELSREQPLEMGDVLILTPSVEKYGAAIHHLFSSLKGCKVEILHELKNSFFPKLERWLHIVPSRCSKDEILSLLSLDGMKTCLECDEEDLQELRELISRSQCTWGLDDTHKEKFLHLSCIQPSGNQRLGTLRALLDDLFLKEVHTPSGEGLPFSSWSLFSRFFSLVHGFLSLWEAPFEGALKKPFSFWLTKLQESVKKISLSFSLDELIDFETVAEKLALVRDEYTFSKFVERLREEALLHEKNKLTYRRGHVVVGDLFDTIPHPARLVALVGLDEEALFHDSKPLKRERLCYAALDALMQAKECCMMSYVSFDFELFQRKEPFSFVSLLKEYVLRNFGSIPLKKRGLLDWYEPSKSCREIHIKEGAIHKEKLSESVIDIQAFLRALADPLAHFMKESFGHSRSYLRSTSPSLFASAREIERRVEEELLLQGPSKSKEGMRDMLAVQEMRELKKACSIYLPPHAQKPKISLTIPKTQFSRLSLQGELHLFHPYATLLVAEDVEKRVIEELWPKLSILSLFHKEIEQLGVEPAVFFAKQGIKKPLKPIVDQKALENFWHLINKMPCPFVSSLLSALLHKKASFALFEEKLQEKIEEKDTLLSSFALLVPKRDREEQFPLWKEQAEQMIRPWLQWIEEGERL